MNFEKDAVLGLCHDDEKAEAPVYVLLNGKVLLKEHTLDKPDHFNVISMATQGSILGVKKLD